MFNGKALKALRTQRDMTHSQLAEQMREAGAYDGTTDTTIDHWERDVSSPGLHDLSLLCSIFSTHVIRFLNQQADSVPLPRQLISDLLEGLRLGDARWALGMLQGALTMLGMTPAWDNATSSDGPALGGTPDSDDESIGTEALLDALDSGADDAEGEGS